MNEEAIEQELLEKGLNAPRLTPSHIDKTIARAEYYVFPGSCTTVCQLTLNNGYTVIGYSACASPENFDKAIGEKVAYTNARDEVWPLEGYLLKDALYCGKYSDDQAN
ncbi:MAG: hypothetical protein LPD71_00225 [Shewanella sp.]|nr:hypothetical protein [Shewanella sp.]MCF1459504.1 hypothetical protein [Shewanella sp.]